MVLCYTQGQTGSKWQSHTDCGSVHQATIPRVPVPVLTLTTRRSLASENPEFKYHSFFSLYLQSSLFCSFTRFLTCNYEGPILPLRDTMRIRDDECKWLVKPGM